MGIESAPGYYEYEIPAGFLVSQEIAKSARDNYRQSYQDVWRVPSAFGLPPASSFAHGNRPPAADYGGYLGTPNTIGAWNPDYGLTIGATTTLPGDYYAPRDSAWNGTRWTTPNDASYRTWAGNANDIAYLAAGYSQFYPGYQRLAGNLGAPGQWDSVAQTAYDTLLASAGEERKDAMSDAKARLGSSGAYGSTLGKTTLKQISGRDLSQQMANQMDQVLDYYAGERNADFNRGLDLLSLDAQSSAAGRMPIGSADYYGSLGQGWESINRINATARAQKASLAGVFDDVLRRLIKARGGDSIIGGGGGAITDYENLASPSQVYQHLPRDQQFASLFGAPGSTGPYYGS